MRDVEEFILTLPKDEQVIVKRLRSLILQAEPRITEKITYGVPYFSRHRMLFFLWPASAVPCADHAKKKPAPPKVSLGFCYGNLLSNEQRLLQKDGRKQVFTIPISSLSAIDERILMEIFNEAIIVDQQFSKQKKH